MSGMRWLGVITLGVSCGGARPGDVGRDRSGPVPVAESPPSEAPASIEPAGPLPKPPSPVVELRAGWGFVVARLEDGSLWYWGHWLDGPDQAQPIPTRIDRADVVGLAASSSDSYLCLRFAKGGVECLSRPTIGGVDWNDGWASKFRAEPVAPSLSGVVQVAVGSYHGCARLEDGTA
ncbi:MAG: hypothetical protein KDK70_07620 [Myxococcales bacterium]|nr:hypothetical protein [Myxococcales bacterium]